MASDDKTYDFNKRKHSEDHNDTEPDKKHKSTDTNNFLNFREDSLYSYDHILQALKEFRLTTKSSHLDELMKDFISTLIGFQLKINNAIPQTLVEDRRNQFMAMKALIHRTTKMINNVTPFVPIEDAATNMSLVTKDTKPFAKAENKILASVSSESKKLTKRFDAPFRVKEFRENEPKIEKREIWYCPCNELRKPEFVSDNCLAPADVIVFHGSDCADGFMSLVAYWNNTVILKCKYEFADVSLWQFKDSSNPCKGHTLFPTAAGPKLTPAHIALFEGKNVVMLDVSFLKDPNDMKRIVDASKSTLIADHHKSAIKALTDVNLGPKFSKILDSSRAGCQIAWDMTTEHKDRARPFLIDVVGDTDTWQFKVPNSRELERYLKDNFKFNTADFNNIHSFMLQLSEDKVLAVNKGAASIEMRQPLIDSAIKQMSVRSFTMPRSNKKYKVLLTHIDWSFVSETGNQMCTQHECDFAAIYNYNFSNIISISLRSNSFADNIVDVSEIAEEFGGGGHQSAAGFKIYNNSTLLLSHPNGAPISMLSNNPADCDETSPIKLLFPKWRGVDDTEPAKYTIKRVVSYGDDLEDNSKQSHALDFIRTNPPNLSMILQKNSTKSDSLAFVLHTGVNDEVDQKLLEILNMFEAGGACHPLQV